MDGVSYETQTHSWRFASLDCYYTTRDALYMPGNHLHFMWENSEISWPVKISRQQYIIYWKRWQNMPKEAVGNYSQIIDCMEISSLW